MAHTSVRSLLLCKFFARFVRRSLFSLQISLRTLLIGSSREYRAREHIARHTRTWRASISARDDDRVARARLERSVTARLRSYVLVTTRLTSRGYKKPERHLRAAQRADDAFHLYIDFAPQCFHAYS